MGVCSAHEGCRVGGLWVESESDFFCLTPDAQLEGHFLHPKLGIPVEMAVSFETYCNRFLAVHHDFH